MRLILMPEDELSAFQTVPGHPEWVQINFREGEPLRVPLRVFVEFGCKIHMTVPSSLYKQLQFEAAKASAKDRVLRTLSRRPITVYQAKALLKKEDIPGLIQQPVIEDLERSGLLDDRQYAASFAASKSGRMSRAEMVWRLSQHGVARDVAEEAVNCAESSEREWEAALGFGRKYWQRHDRDEIAQRSRKLGAYLQRRGFSMAIVRQVLVTLRDELS